ncbi:MAG: biotin--[acetyl-CoA-carboxylase] ligase [Rhizobiales bacterium]|nr:biotin--[acetyl-CoA-carboxylase] ligase [Hyphomicrobiales bacterium]
MRNRVIHFERVDSTNSEAHRLAGQGERGPLWLWADEQTGGRGRLGRTWVSEPGNLYATFLFPITGGPDVAAQVSFVAALAVHDLVTALLPDAKPFIKWPNDVLIDGAKFCGLLAEVAASNPTAVAVGCGINLLQAPQDMPYPVTALARHGDIPGIESILQILDARLSSQLAIWSEGRGFAAIRDRWMERAAGLNGKAVAVIGEEEVRGIFRGLAADGALILELPGGTQKHIHAGDVRFAAIEALRKS